MGEIQKIIVKHAGGEYPVFVGADFAAYRARLSGKDKEEWNKYVRGNGATVVVSNEKIWGISKTKIENIFVNANAPWRHPVISDLSGDGEMLKDWKTLEFVLEKLAYKKIRRNSTIVAVGGGVIGDLAGFAAAIYMRGVRLIQVPTTLLAQVDSAIGGKTGINHRWGKNLIGAFHQPAAVVCDTNFLKTLPEKEYRSGLAEVVKYGLLGDAEFFAWLEKNAAALMDYKTTGNPAVQNAIVRSVKMKAEIVGEDERETSGKRALLNLGHTFAHALENAAGYGEWLHGEAVAVGLVAVAKLSEKIAKFPAADTKRIIALLKEFNLPISFSGMEPDKILSAMRMDKKFTARDKRFVLMNSIGNAKLHNIKRDDMQKVVAVVEEMCEKESKP
ncbi:MAG: 3-dehydroquinate synthase [Betaproteobacteria bacterium]|nr:3-dehydroquinate synthase [Betaproteobacteria bacterium]